VGLIVLYGAVTLVRSLVQPKILGSQLGLHPLAALVAMYVGYRAAGLWGMILFPVLLLLIRQAAPYIKSLDLP
jgi:predicted PurR-regulated permease PerM